MKKNIIYIALAGVLFDAPACIKTNGVTGSSSLNIVNAINNSNPIVTNFTPLNAKDVPEEALRYYGSANSISWGNSYESGSYIGNTYLSISQNSDTTSTLWTGEFDLANGSIHTLFFCGDTSSVDTLFTTDIIPSYPLSDSVMGIRFVNLSAGSNPISINLEGNPNGSEVTALAYRAITGFKQYPNNSMTIDYLFVIRDAATGDSLTQFDFLNAGSSNNGNGLTDPNNGNLLTFKNITIAVYGSVTNPTIPLTAMVMDDY